MSKWLISTGILVLALLLATGPLGCTASKPAAPDSIKLGAVVPLTGRYAAGGAQVKAGYELAVADINKAGGVYIKEYGKMDLNHLGACLDCQPDCGADRLQQPNRYPESHRSFHQERIGSHRETRVSGHS